MQVAHLVFRKPFAGSVQVLSDLEYFFSAPFSGFGKVSFELC